MAIETVTAEDHVFGNIPPGASLHVMTASADTSVTANATIADEDPKGNQVPHEPLGHDKVFNHTFETAMEAGHVYAIRVFLGFTGVATVTVNAKVMSGPTELGKMPESTFTGSLGALAEQRIRASVKKSAA